MGDYIRWDYCDLTPSQDTVDQARLVVCGHATDAADALALLDCLGLAPTSDEKAALAREQVVVPLRAGRRVS